MKPPILSAQQLSCQRGERELFTGLDFDLMASQCLHLTGSNGSGKTSLLRILSGLAEADSGAVLWNDQRIRANAEFFQASAYLGHKDALKNELSAIENLRAAQRLDGIHDEPALDQCLLKMQILECADLLAQSLSFGQRRRLGFAKLLLRAYSLWILDEPFTGIDQSGRALIESICLEHLQAGGLILLTHHQSLENSQLAAYLHCLDLDQMPTTQGGL